MGMRVGVAQHHGLAFEAAQVWESAEGVERGVHQEALGLRAGPGIANIGVADYGFGAFDHEVGIGGEAGAIEKSKAGEGAGGDELAGEVGRGVEIPAVGIEIGCGFFVDQGGELIERNFVERNWRKRAHA
jgi:hypothetical protein